MSMEKSFQTAEIRVTMETEDMDEYYLENKIMDKLKPILTGVIHQVDFLVVIVYFHLIDDYNFITSSSEFKDNKYRLDFLKALSNDILEDKLLIKLLNKESAISNYIIDIIDKLPVTYIQIMIMEDMVSAKYYSSVDNCKENVLRVIESCKKILKEKLR